MAAWWAWGGENGDGFRIMFTTHLIRSGRAQRRHVTREEAAAAALGGPAPPGFDHGGEEATGRPPTEHTIRIEHEIEVDIGHEIGIEKLVGAAGVVELRTHKTGSKKFSSNAMHAIIEIMARDSYDGP